MPFYEAVYIFGALPCPSSSPTIFTGMLSPELDYNIELIWFRREAASQPLFQRASIIADMTCRQDR